MIFLIISNEQSWYCGNVMRYYVPWHMLIKELSIVLCHTARGILAWTNPPLSWYARGISYRAGGLAWPPCDAIPLGITRDKMIPRGYRGMCRCVPTRAVFSLSLFFGFSHRPSSLSLLFNSLLPSFLLFLSLSSHISSPIFFPFYTFLPFFSYVFL